MKIPKQIQIAGKVIDVKFVEDLGESNGCAKLEECVILLEKNIAPQMQEEAFLHELMHFIFVIGGEETLGENERLVGLISELFYQVVKQL